jgi:hypothetical protein
MLISAEKPSPLDVERLTQLAYLPEPPSGQVHVEVLTLLIDPLYMHQPPISYENWG